MGNTRHRAATVHTKLVIVPLLLVSPLLLIAGRVVGGSSPAQAAARDPFHALLSRSQDVGLSPSSRKVMFLALLRGPSARYWESQIASMYNPRSLDFQHYKTAGDTTQNSALARTARRVQDYLRPRGLQASGEPGSDSILISGRASAFETVFRVAIHSYIAPSGDHYYASAHDPVIPSPLTSSIVATGHISSYEDRRPHIIPVSGLRPADLLTTYNIATLHSQNFTGRHQTIAFIEIDGFRQSDLNLFTQHFGLPPEHPIIRAGQALSKVEGEAELDLEVAHEIAPAARLVVYNCSDSCSDTSLVQLESKAVIQNPRSIISISLGGCESAEGSGTLKAESRLFARADEMGETVLVASGDSGAYTCIDQNWGSPPSPQYIGVSSPASEPGVTGVGGTSLGLHGNSSLYREQAWQNSAATAASGGGLSSYFARPFWQRGPGVVNTFNTSNRREIPDVSADADPLTAAQVVIDGQLTQAGGTSQAAPIWAGIVADVNQYLHSQRLPVAGFLNPALYSLAAGRPPYPALHDIQLGTNLAYPATPGYDLATGLGSPDAWNLARDLAAYERRAS